ncbi:hypothetical protein GQ600_4223 [Phytophthora cactorum]|nr:hypothetical protein GQ600_4223 [Phytophthora cactorum]
MHLLTALCYTIRAQGVPSRSNTTARAQNPNCQEYARPFVCTHHGKYKSQASSKRPRQEARAQSACTCSVSPVGPVWSSRALSKCWILWCINAADLLLIFTDKCMCPTGGYCEEDICVKLPSASWSTTTAFLNIRLEPTLLIIWS